MRHALIMAGGAGTRLWPLSRKLRPKQLLQLFDGKSLLRLARERLEGLFPPECIWVITSATYLDQVAAELPDVPRANLIGEPVGRDTANAIGLAAHLIAGRDADATMGVFTADHVIGPQDRFAAAIETGLAAAEQHPDALVTFGITPREPHTGYGYIRRDGSVGPPRPTAVGTGGDDQTRSPHGRPFASAQGRPFASAQGKHGRGTRSGGVPVYRVAEFKEKPTREVAEQYVRSGEYYWNSGMFAWRVGAILGEIERNLPKNAAVLASIASDWPARAAEFAGLPKISIDYGVMEKAARVLVVEMNCEWRDVGSWTALAATRTPDAAGNVVFAPRTLTVDASGNILVADTDHLIVALGVDDLVVVHSADATLICRKDQVERIKDLARLRQERFGEDYE